MTAAGALVIATHIAPVSVWALNFAMMFALALGIDYALFLVVRFRAALARRGAQRGDRQAAIDAVAETMATAGKAVAFSGVTVLVSLSTVLLVPSPAFRSMALGIMLSVVAVLAATLTLLPAVLGKLGTRIDAGRIRLPGARRRDARHAARAAARGRRNGRAAPPRAGEGAAPLGRGAAPPALDRRRARRRRTGGARRAGARAAHRHAVASRSSLPTSPPAPATSRSSTPSAPARRACCRSSRPPARPPRRSRRSTTDPGIAAALPAGQHNGWTMTMAIPTTDASAPRPAPPSTGIRTELPRGSLVGGAAAENHDLQKVLSARTPLVFGLLIGLGFLLLLVALGSPLVAFVGTVTNLASIAAAFGVARLIFQNGHLAGLLNFEPQGFVDAWGPLFFGAMLTGVAMDYTLFLLSAAREHYDATGDPHHAMREALRTSGRVVVAAAGVMVAVFLTFALSGPLAPKEMGIILAVAVFLDALCIRLIVLPVVLRLTGHAAWHAPRWLARALPDVRFAH